MSLPTTLFFLDEKGNQMISPITVKQKEYSNLSNLLKFLENNKLPYNKHALSILQDKKNEFINLFYILYKHIKGSLCLL